LLTKAKTYDEVLDLSEQGDSSRVDMLVGDIYGRDYDRFQLSADTVASSFGKSVSRANPRENAADGDIIRALLMMITNNIGQVAYLNAQVHGTNRIFFIGNFLRQNVVRTPWRLRGARRFC
jgi:type II pantothenate kinase